MSLVRNQEWPPKSYSGPRKLITLRLSSWDERQTQTQSHASSYNATGLRHDRSGTRLIHHATDPPRDGAPRDGAPRDGATTRRETKPTPTTAPECLNGTTEHELNDRIPAAQANARRAISAPAHHHFGHFQSDICTLHNAVFP